MDIQVKDYLFNKTNKTITFTQFSSIRLDSVRMIANTTAGVIIYTFVDPLLGGTVLGNVLTLNYDTTTMSNGDSLQIIYNDESLNANSLNQETLNSLVVTLNELASRLNIFASMANAGAPGLRVAPIGTTTISGNVNASVSNATVAYEGGVPSYVNVVSGMNMTSMESNIKNVTV